MAMTKCKVCGVRLIMHKDLRYEIVKYPVGLNVLTESPKIYECFDCQHCGCQNIVNVREGNAPNPEDMKG